MSDQLRGRRGECGELDRLLEAVRTGQSRVLVLHGEAGIGKTALLAYLADRASDCRLARASGVESEVELAFAGLHHLCVPMLDGVAQLPDPQRVAIRTAFGLSEGPAPDLFLVGLAVLGLMSEVSVDQPLVCIIDDAQWLDSASSRVLAFVARRLLAESVALVFGSRDPVDDRTLAGLPRLPVEPIDDADARALLLSAVPGRLDHGVRDRIVAEARGNPLALMELPRGRSTAELAGGFRHPDSRSLEHRIEQSFLRQIEALPEDTRRLLLLAAAEPVGDVALLWRAARRLRISPSSSEPAEVAGLIDVGGRVLFRHPLLRAAAYGTAAPPDRREVHRALAAETDPGTDPDRRAWHAAEAAVGPDEAVAAELEQSADRARRRGGVAAAAAFLERAAMLTANPDRRALRAIAAAQAKSDAADPEAASTLIATAEMGALDEFQAAQVARLRGEIAFARRRGSDAPPLLLEAARRFETLNETLARETFLEAMEAALYVRRSGGPAGVRAVAESVRTRERFGRGTGAGDLLLDAVAVLFTEGHQASAPGLRRAIDAFLAEALQSDEITRGSWLAFPVAVEMAVHELWDYETWGRLAGRAVQLARDVGALYVLPVALAYQAGAHLFAGELKAAATMMEEADSITAATGNAAVPYASLVLAAWQGAEAKAVWLTEAIVADAEVRGEGRVDGVAGYATAVLYTGLGRYDEALIGARSACEENLGFLGWSLAELVEAATRSGTLEEATTALGRLKERTAASGTDWALGIEARSEALVSDGDTAESLYAKAIESLERTALTTHLARARLVYGEWLRRENRRRDAREQLRSAHELFAEMGADAFAERARRELLATGEKVRPRSVETRYSLTPQESQIAQLAADGATNPEIGSQLFISPRTVEYHLHKVYSKLGISSRRALRTALRQAPARTPAVGSVTTAPPIRAPR